MKRRDFMQMSGLGMGALMLPSVPVFGSSVSEAHLLEPWIDVVLKKKYAEIALNETKSKGATYTDVRIGRYLQQFVFTREKQVQNIVNAESYGIGIRVIANGTWGFSATRCHARGNCQMCSYGGRYCESEFQVPERTCCAG